MPNSNTKIQIKRSDSTKELLANEVLEYGEPVFLEGDEKHKYLAIGNDLSNHLLSDATFFEGVTNSNLIGKTVYADTSNNAILQDGTPVKASKVNVANLDLSTNSANRYHILLYQASGADTGNLYSVQQEKGLYVTQNGVIRGSVWNDYAETRKCLSGKPGQVVCENGDGTLSVSKEHLQMLPYIISDTCGVAIGVTEEEDETCQPVAISGRALVYVNCDVKIGDVLCADKDGFATKMNRNEISLYPDRIVGIVSEIPTYTRWNGVIIDGRVWVKVY